MAAAGQRGGAMTERERLALLLVCDAVIAGALNPCARIEVEALRKARLAMDDEAFAIARGDSVDEALLADGTVLRPMTPEPDAAVLGRATQALGEAGKPDPAQALDKALERILAICVGSHDGHAEMRGELQKIEALARNARRWLEMENRT